VPVCIRICHRPPARRCRCARNLPVDRDRIAALGLGSQLGCNIHRFGAPLVHAWPEYRSHLAGANFPLYTGEVVGSIATAPTRITNVIRNFIAAVVADDLVPRNLYPPCTHAAAKSSPRHRPSRQSAMPSTGRERRRSSDQEAALNGLAALARRACLGETSRPYLLALTSLSPNPTKRSSVGMVKLFCLGIFEAAHLRSAAVWRFQKASSK
jgi:hypothetical protein